VTLLQVIFFSCFVFVACAIPLIVFLLGQKSLMEDKIKRLENKVNSMEFWLDLYQNSTDEY